MASDSSITAAETFYQPQAVEVVSKSSAEPAKEMAATVESKQQEDVAKKESSAEDYELTLEILASQNNEDRTQEREQAAEKIRVAEEQRQTIEKKAKVTQDKLEHIESTLSWKATAPIRDGIYLLKQYFK